MFRVAILWIPGIDAFEPTNHFSLLPGLDNQVIDLGSVISDARLVVPVELRNPGPETLNVVALTVAEVPSSRAASFAAESSEVYLRKGI